MSFVDHGSINYRDEVTRKMVHLCSLSIPVIGYFITKQSAMTILGILSAIAVVVDVGRHFILSWARMIKVVFGPIMREHETDEKKKNLNGATYVLLSALLCVWIFPKIIFITAFTILIISDTTAALIGRKFGRHKFLLKSLEGTTAFFVSAAIVICLTPKIDCHNSTEYAIGIIAAFVGAIMENISFGWADDNLSIPISVGFAMWGLYHWLLPNVKLILTNVPR
jgi:dolichol kinase